MDVRRCMLSALHKGPIANHLLQNLPHLTQRALCQHTPGWIHSHRLADNGEVTICGTCLIPVPIRHFVQVTNAAGLGMCPCSRAPVLLRQLLTCLLACLCISDIFKPTGTSAGAQRACNIRRLELSLHHCTGQNANNSDAHSSRHLSKALGQGNSGS